MAPGNTNNIVKQLLFDPISTGADRLCIISYQATPSMASWLLKIIYHMMALKNFKETGIQRYIKTLHAVTFIKAPYPKQICLSG